MDIGKVGEYAIEYLSVLQTEAWPDRLPERNWLLFVMIGEAGQVLFSKVTVECMRHQPLSICCAGPAAPLLEDWFDEEIVTVALAWEDEHQQPYDYKFAPLTTAHIDVDEGFWYAATLAPDMAAEAVETIFCLDLTGTQQARISQLIALINSGWLPPDTEND